jgi:hypothetical protein
MDHCLTRFIPNPTLTFDPGFSSRHAFSFPDVVLITSLPVRGRPISKTYSMNRDMRQRYDSFPAAYDTRSMKRPKPASFQAYQLVTQSTTCIKCIPNRAGRQASLCRRGTTLAASTRFPHRLADNLGSHDWDAQLVDCSFVFLALPPYHAVVGRGVVDQI